MSQPQEKPRLGVVRETAPEKRLRILVVNDDDAVTVVLRSGFEPLRNVVLEIVPRRRGCHPPAGSRTLRSRGARSGAGDRRLRAAEARQAPLSLDRHAGRQPQPRTRSSCARRSSAGSTA
jgi:hypothetical protein